MTNPDKKNTCKDKNNLLFAALSIAFLFSLFAILDNYFNDYFTKFQNAKYYGSLSAQTSVFCDISGDKNKEIKYEFEANFSDIELNSPDFLDTLSFHPNNLYRLISYSQKMYPNPLYSTDKLRISDLVLFCDNHQDYEEKQIEKRRLLETKKYAKAMNE